MKVKFSRLPVAPLEPSAQKRVYERAVSLSPSQSSQAAATTALRFHAAGAAAEAKSPAATSAKLGPADISIEVLSMEDLPAATAVHRTAFPRAAVSRLGREVTQRYLDSLVSGPHDIVALGAFENDWLVGYCLAGEWNDPAAYFLRTNLLFMAWHVLAHPWTLTDPFFRERIKHGLELIRPRRARPVPQKTEESKPRTFTILYLAVEPGYQGRSIGRSLLAAAEDTARHRGFNQINLSLYLDNFKAITFYERNGWQRVHTDARWIGYMSKALS